VYFHWTPYLSYVTLLCYTVKFTSKVKGKRVGTKSSRSQRLMCQTAGYIARQALALFEKWAADK
jgi:hypothetical protein